MREIKFRAWDRTLEPRMVSWNELKPHKVWDVFLHLSEVTLMQYTGLKDKNGVEIYEGDILTDKFDDRFIVEIIPGRMQMRRIGAREKGESKHGCYNIAGEIIGNIYETPELLK